MTSYEKSIIDYYNDYHTLRSTSKQFGITTAQIRTILKRFGVSCRRRYANPGLPEHHISGVYFVQGTMTRLVKIGVADNVAIRLKALQSGSPDILTVVGILRQQGRQQERQLHERFGKNRIHGEWFHEDVLNDLPILLAENNNNL